MASKYADEPHKQHLLRANVCPDSGTMLVAPQGLDGSGGSQPIVSIHPLAPLSSGSPLSRVALCSLLEQVRNVAKDAASVDFRVHRVGAEKRSYQIT